MDRGRRSVAAGQRQTVDLRTALAVTALALADRRLSDGNADRLRRTVDARLGSGLARRSRRGRVREHGRQSESNVTGAAGCWSRAIGPLISGCNRPRWR